MRLVLRVLALLAVPVLYVVGSAGSAAAASVDVPRPADGLYSCPGGVEVVLPVGKGTWSPGRVVGSDQLFRPYAFSYSIAVGDEEPTTTLSTSRSNASSGAITCTATRDQLDEGGFVIGTLTYTVTGVIRT
jgi:hypothetical protein